MTEKDYGSIIREHGLNTFFVAEGDGAHNIRKQIVIPANPCCNCYSVAKVFTVTAIGMLYDRGLLIPATRMADVLAAYLPADMDPRWEKVTLHDLMLHKVGFGHGMLDIDAEDASAFPEDYLGYVLSSALPHEPGTTAQYTDAAFYLLSRVAAEVSGMDLADLLRPALMNTMKFKEFAWSVCPRGYSMGATGLYLRTEDMVKLGIVYINGGEWQGERIISREWVDTVLKNGYELKECGNGWYRKGGMHGQLLMLHPTEKLAVACHSYDGRLNANIFLK